MGEIKLKYTVHSVDHDAQVEVEAKIDDGDGGTETTMATVKGFVLEATLDGTDQSHTWRLRGKTDAEVGDTVEVTMAFTKAAPAPDAEPAAGTPGS